MKCQNCGIEFEPKIATDARFHDDKCRQTYWNTIRKINRLEDIARKAAQELKRIRDNQPQHQSAAASSLNAIGYWLQQEDERF